jgi:hypothetical protein
VATLFLWLRFVRVQEVHAVKKVCTRRAFVAGSAMTLTSLACGSLASLRPIQINHAPKRFPRRMADFTANICGMLAPGVTRASYRLNGDLWLPVRHALPRVPSPLFTLELSHEHLRAGENHLEIEAGSFWPGSARREKIVFAYDPSPITPPFHMNWAEQELDVQDGQWEKISHDRQVWIRPVPGSENYDRIIVVTGAFAEARRLELELIFRRSTAGENPFGFGVLPLWGGRPDDAGVSPRRGWNFSLAWYYSHYRGVGMEFSYKHGSQPPLWISTYRNLELQPDRAHHLVIETWPEQEANGRHLRYRQRMLWQMQGETGRGEWLELSDTEGATIPPREYGIALIAHRCQVEFGPVKILPLAVSYA